MQAKLLAGGRMALPKNRAHVNADKRYNKQCRILHKPYENCGQTNEAIANLLFHPRATIQLDEGTLVDPRHNYGDQDMPLQHAVNPARAGFGPDPRIPGWNVREYNPAVPGSRNLYDDLMWLIDQPGLLFQVAILPGLHEFGFETRCQLVQFIDSTPAVHHSVGSVDPPQVVMQQGNQASGAGESYSAFWWAGVGGRKDGPTSEALEQHRQRFGFGRDCRNHYDGFARAINDYMHSDTKSECLAAWHNVPSDPENMGFCDCVGISTNLGCRYPATWDPDSEAAAYANTEANEKKWTRLNADPPDVNRVEVKFKQVDCEHVPQLWSTMNLKYSKGSGFAGEDTCPGADIGNPEPWNPQDPLDEPFSFSQLALIMRAANNCWRFQ